MKKTNYLSYKIIFDIILEIAEFVPSLKPVVYKVHMYINIKLKQFNMIKEKALEFQGLGNWCRLRDLGSSVCKPRSFRSRSLAWQQTLTAHNENTGVAVFSIGSRPLGFKSQILIP